NSSGKECVLVPVELLDHLRAQVQPPAALTGAVLLGASYQGEVVERVAHFRATFEAYCFSEEPTLLALPLEGDLEGAQWLDHVRVDTVQLPHPQTGFGLTVRGKGRHTVELQFKKLVEILADEPGAPATGGSERSLTLAAPRLLVSRLSLKVPAPAAYL